MILRKWLIVLALTSIRYSIIEGDTLQSIAEKFCKTNNPVEVMEFREGIREINYDILGNSEVSKGMVIKINRFEERINCE